MSRVSSKSGLSPSATRGSNAIDLGKDSGVDMGQKSQPSISSGGIGITQEVGSIGGASVALGVGVEVSPIGIDISGDPSKGTLGIAGSAELPGGLLGLSGGIKLDTNTGEIIGGSIGGEIGGLGINLSSEEGNVGLEFTLQIPGTPIEFSLGLQFPEEKKPTPTPTPTPTPFFPTTPTPPLTPSTPNLDCKKAWVTWREDTYFRVNTEINHPIAGITKLYPVNSSITLNDRLKEIYPWIIDNSDYALANLFGINISAPGTVPILTRVANPYFYYAYSIGTGSSSGVGFTQLFDPVLQQAAAAILIVRSSWHNIYTTREGTLLEVDLTELAYGREITGFDTNGITQWGEWKLTKTKVNRMVCGDEAPIVLPPVVPPFPNPPPRKVMDECCRDSIKLQRLIVRHLGAARTTIPESLPDGVEGIGSVQEGIPQAFPFKVKKRWINPTAKDEENIAIMNARQLTLVLGGMLERLERVLGTAEFYKDSDKKLRQSEGNLLSWLSGGNPDFNYPDPNDFWLNTDDGTINEKKLEVRSIADGLRYQIEALNRLERILPIAELKDSSIPARWIYPNGKGQLRVGNLIHLCEYMIRKSDKDMGYWPQKITIKAANPAIKDDEPIIKEVHSQADMLRVILQQILDIEGDGDMGSNYDLRRTYLDVMAFQMLAKNNKYLQAITEYLSFDMVEEVSKIPIPFDPFAGKERSSIEEWWIKYGFGEAPPTLPTANTENEIEQLSEGVLQNSELEVNTIKFGSLDEKKDPKTLKEALIEILKHTSASAAAVTEVANESALDRVVDAAGIAQKLASFLMRRDIRESLGIGDFDNWISSAEKGYTDNLESESLRFPESNPLEPYGRPTTQNPTIREIDTKDTKAD